MESNSQLSNWKNIVRMQLSPFWRVVGKPNCLRNGSMLKGNCSRGPGCRVTVSVAMFPDLAKSDSTCFSKYLEKLHFISQLVNERSINNEACYSITSFLDLLVNRMPHWPFSRLDISCTFSLHSSSLLLPRATAITRFFPRKNLYVKNKDGEKSYLRLSIFSSIPAVLPFISY